VGSHSLKHFDLWSSYKQSKDINLRNTIFMKYRELVTKVVFQLASNYNNYIDLDDLISYGNIGLLDAIEKFDIDKGVKFETYASIRIRGAIIDEIRKLDWVPRSTRQKFKMVERAIDEVENTLGKSATTREVANHLSVSSEELDKILAQMHSYAIISMDDQILELINEASIGNSHQNQLTPEDIVVEQEIKTNLTKAIENLQERDRLIITLYYYEEFTLKEIGKVLNVTESRVSQLHTRALSRLKAKLTTT